MISSYVLRSVFSLSGKRSALLNNFLTNVCPKPVFFRVSKILCDGYKIEIKMPALSPTMTEGTIVKWLKKEGDEIIPGDILCEIQTDKALVGLETEEEGTLDKIVIPENTQNVQLGEIIAIVLGQGEAIEKLKENFSAEHQKENPSFVKHNVNLLIGPAVKKLLLQFNIKHLDVTASGPKHNVLKGDVLKFIKDHNLKHVTKSVDKHVTKSMDKHVTKSVEKPGRSLARSFFDIPVESSKSEIARLLVQSKSSAPHGYMSTDCKVDNLLNCIEKFHKDGVAVSLSGFIVKSAAVTLKRVSALNHLNGHSNSINVSITDVNEGESKTSFIKNAGSLKLPSISEQIEGSSVSEFSERAFQISNLSSLGVIDFVEIISPNDVAILTISGMKSSFKKGYSVRKLRATLSFDCYNVSESDAGAFLETFKTFLENPSSLLCYD